MSDAERLARVMLLHLDDADNESLGLLVSRCGAEDAIAVIRSGRPPAGLAAESQKPEAFERRLRCWQRRLTSADPQRDLAESERLHSRLVCPGDTEWPTQLDDLDLQRPHALWVLGQEDLRFSCLRSVAIVGSRAASPYGTHIAAMMAAELTERGWCVVSGGAYGIDAAAHRGALAADGLSLAALATGIDVRYPPGNHGLLSELATSGLLISEAAPGTTPTRGRFLVRNRLIAALTRGTVVVEAAARSGAANTAGHAERLGRPLMAVPGPVSSRQSVGCHELLRNGAGCVTDAADVLEIVGKIGEDLAPERRGPVLPRDQLDDTKRRVLDAFPARASMGPAQIAITVGIGLDTALSCLGGLAAGGFVERCETGWRLKRETRS